MAGLTQSGYVARSPKYLDFVWLKYIKVTLFSTNSPSSSSILFIHPLSIMPVQSRLAILPALTSTDIVPYNSVQNPNPLNEIGMAPPRILMIEGFSQNMLLSATMWEEVHKLFKMAQSVGLEALEWIGEVKRCCESIGKRHGWHWDDPEAGAVAIHTHLPLSEGQGQIKYRSYPALASNSPINNNPPSNAS